MSATDGWMIYRTIYKIFTVDNTRCAKNVIAAVYNTYYNYKWQLT